MTAPDEARDVLSDLVSVSADIYSRWDKDQRAGKLLQALAGTIAVGYDPRVDRIRAALNAARAEGHGSVMDVYTRIAAMRESDDQAERIVADIWSDVTGRRGWRQEHEGFDPDVQNQIVDAWLKMVRRGLRLEEPKDPPPGEVER